MTNHKKVQDNLFFEVQGMLRFTLVIVIVFLASLGVSAQEADTTKYDEDFVKTSLIIASPGDMLYSKVGHCAIRMQCPQYKLDYVFSYESEDARQKVLTFLAGKLKMGMFSVPTDEYISSYKKEGRSVAEYTLNIPIDAKRNLWKVLDTHVMEGANLPYDFITRGCAHSVLTMIDEGIFPLTLEFDSFPKTFATSTRRELTGLQMKDHPWTWCFLNLLVNGSIDDTDCSNEDKVIMPADLVESLLKARINGKPLISEAPKALLTGKSEKSTCWFTPLMLAIILLVITVIATLIKWNFWNYVLLAIQTVLGIFILYLVAFSSLCCTEWSWLIIPFNPLPLIFWKWRKRWALPFSVIITLWAAAMLLYPHQLTDTTFIVLGIALVLNYVNIFIRNKKHSKHIDARTTKRRGVKMA